MLTWYILLLLTTSEDLTADLSLWSFRSLWDFCEDKRGAWYLNLSKCMSRLDSYLPFVYSIGRWVDSYGQYFIQSWTVGTVIVYVGINQNFVKKKLMIGFQECCTCICESNVARSHCLCSNPHPRREISLKENGFGQATMTSISYQFWKKFMENHLIISRYIW